MVLVYFPVLCKFDDALSAQIHCLSRDRQILLNAIEANSFGIDVQDTTLINLERYVHFLFSSRKRWDTIEYELTNLVIVAG